jgi:hypothetical protein
MPNGAAGGFGGKGAPANGKKPGQQQAAEYQAQAPGC